MAMEHLTASGVTHKPARGTTVLSQFHIHAVVITYGYRKPTPVSAIGLLAMRCLQPLECIPEIGKISTGHPSHTRRSQEDLSHLSAKSHFLPVTGRSHRVNWSLETFIGAPSLHLLTTQ